jgi:adhesin transport system outer membrane protein
MENYMASKKIICLFGLASCLFSSLVLADTLQDAVTRTIQTNPDILEKIKIWLASEQGVRAAQGGYLPTIDINANAGDENSKNNNTNFDYVNLYTDTAGVTLRQMIFDGFFTSSEVARNKNLSTANNYQFQGTANDTALLACKAYLDVLTTQRIVALAKDNYNSVQKIYDMIQCRAESGLGRDADVNQASGRLALAKANLVAAQNNYLDAQATYVKIVGVQPNNLSFPDEPSDSRLPIDLQTAIKNAIDNHPILKAAEANILEAKAQHDSALSTNYPRVDAVLNGNVSNNLSGVKGDYGDQTAMLQLSYNLYHGGSDLAKQRQTAYQIEQAQELRARTYNQVVENMKLSWDALTSARDQLPSLLKHQNASKATVGAYYEQFQLNKRTLLDVLNSQDELFNSQVSYVNGQSNVIFSKFRVLNGENALLPYLHVPVLPTDTQQVTTTPQPVVPKKVLTPVTPLPAQQPAAQSKVAIADKTIAPKALNNYTIQLYSTYDKNDAINYIVKNDLKSRAAFYPAKYDNQTKYVVIYGSYPTSQQALAAMQTLPKNIQQWNPTIKPFSVVQSEIAS